MTNTLLTYSVNVVHMNLTRFEVEMRLLKLFIF